MNFAYLTIKLVKYYPFLFCSKSFKTWFFKKVSFLHLSSANWIFTRKHVHFAMMSQEVHLFWVCLSIWLDQFCVNFVLKYLMINNQGNDLRYFNYLIFAFLKYQHVGRDWKIVFMRQFNCTAKCAFQTKFFNMMILSVFSCVSSVDSWFCTQEMFGTKLASCFSFSYDLSIKPKRAAILYYKK